jgi:hypothetical protein
MTILPKPVHHVSLGATVTSDLHQPSNAVPTSDHEHTWRSVDHGDTPQEWAFQCTICHRTRAGLRVGSHGELESAFDVVIEQRHASTDERERALDVRESRLRAQESRQIQRKDEVEHVLMQAAQRDQVTDARDEAADKRDVAAIARARPNLLQDGPDADARREALDDRLHSRGDRRSSAVDRAMLADEGS